MLFSSLLPLSLFPLLITCVIYPFPPSNNSVEGFKPLVGAPKIYTGEIEGIATLQQQFLADLDQILQCQEEETAQIDVEQLSPSSWLFTSLTRDNKRKQCGGDEYKVKLVWGKEVSSVDVVDLKNGSYFIQLRELCVPPSFIPPSSSPSPSPSPSLSPSSPSPFLEIILIFSQGIGMLIPEMKYNCSVGCSLSTSITIPLSFPQNYFPLPPPPLPLCPPNSTLYPNSSRIVMQRGGILGDSQMEAFGKAFGKRSHGWKAPLHPRWLPKLRKTFNSKLPNKAPFNLLHSGLWNLLPHPEIVPPDSLFSDVINSLEHIFTRVIKLSPPLHYLLPLAVHPEEINYRPCKDNKCSARVSGMSNTRVSFLNELLKVLLKHFGIRYIDSFPISSILPSTDGRHYNGNRPHLIVDSWGVCTQDKKNMPGENFLVVPKARCSLPPDLGPLPVVRR